MALPARSLETIRPDPINNGVRLRRRIRCHGPERVDYDRSVCTSLFPVAMHEAGHAFGLYDHNDTNSLMSSSEPYCFPTAHDVVAVKAIYQSR